MEGECRLGSWWPVALAVAWILVVACVAEAAAGESQPEIAVVTPVGDPQLEAAVRQGWFFRWVLPQSEMRVEVGSRARGSWRMTVARWPLRKTLRDRLVDLPLEVPAREATEALRFAGAKYPTATLTMAVRVPDADPSASGEWLVVGDDPDTVSGLVSSILYGSAAGRWENVERVDYVLRENPYLERRGRWRSVDGRWVVDAAGESDGFADRDRWWNGLEPMKGRFVDLLVPSGRAGDDILRSLRNDLDGAFEGWLKRIPVPASGPARHVVVAVEDDYPSQARHTGRIGPAVRGGAADLHLVVDAADFFAYRHALAELAIEREGIARRVSPVLRRGAALWLSGQWYGRSWSDWLPILAAIDSFPTAAQLAAMEESRAGSIPLWTPVAAAVIDALPGSTLAEKLARPVDRSALATILRRVRAAAEEDPPPAPRRAASTLGFQRGVSFAMLNSLDGGYHAPSVEGRLKRLQELGADSISLMPFAYQPDPRSTELRFLNSDPTSETDVGLIYAARRAHALGLRVLWKPHLWVSHQSWPGDVRMQSEADWQAWWTVYRRFILHHAMLAEWSGSELFSVGVELSKTLDREREWRRLIADVRRLYSGVVTYASNWSGGMEHVTFADDLDLMGVDAYWPLSSASDASAEDLQRGARQVASHLAAFAATSGRPLLLTEVGFAARQAAWVEPHGEGGDYSEADQAAAYRALLEALGRPPWLAGAYVWKAFSADRGASGRPDFRFLDRQAEEDVERWFKGR